MLKGRKLIPDIGPDEGYGTGIEMRILVTNESQRDLDGWMRLKFAERWDIL